jgi:hypothetical protein
MSPALHRKASWDRSCSFRARYALGVVPTALRKARLKFGCDENPVAQAMSTSSRSPVSGSRLARSRRSRLNIHAAPSQWPVFADDAWRLRHRGRSYQAVRLCRDLSQAVNLQFKTYDSSPPAPWFQRSLSPTYRSEQPAAPSMKGRCLASAPPSNPQRG